jgi:hypothetical protein
MDAWQLIQRRGLVWPERRVLVCGPTNFTDWDTVKAALRCSRPSTVLHGHSTGVDQLVSIYAQLFRLNEMRFPAQWRTYGAAAAGLRNDQMFAYGKPDLVLLFPNDVNGEDILRRARAARVPVDMITQAADPSSQCPEQPVEQRARA